jgi:2,4-dienoyl-CoA reductase-like NADH-dependent reductase (Old Yellow Enzyme family)
VIRMIRPVDALFRPIGIRDLHLRNRLVMAPMTRNCSPAGVPTSQTIEYYRRRAEGGAGLIITEGVAVNRQGDPGPRVPYFSGEAALAQWALVAQAVHEAGGHIMPQLWHAGTAREFRGTADPAFETVGPSDGYPNIVDGVEQPQRLAIGRAMTQTDIDATIRDCVQFAENAQRLGFDGVELHGGHGYLFDEFFWDRTNRRTDEYNGDVAQRTRFAAETVREIRRQVGPGFPIGLRFSQWKVPSYYDVRMLPTPRDLERFLEPLAASGVDFFDCSTRRYWQAEYPDSGSDLSLAGWTRKITGSITMTVGSVGLDRPLTPPKEGEMSAQPEGLDRLLYMLERGDFDLVGVGRAMIANPDWCSKVKAGRDFELRPFSRELLSELL